MGQMSWLAQLIEMEDEKGLTEFLAGKGFKRPKFAAKEFLKASDEIKEDNHNKALIESKIGEKENENDE